MRTRVQALQDAQEKWETALASSENPMEWGRQLFAAADSLGESGALRRSLTDTSRSESDRGSLVQAIYGDKLDPAVVSILQFVAGERWSRDRDFVGAVEDLGVRAILTSAKRNDDLSDVEEQLYRMLRLLRRERELRIALGDRSVPPARREALARQVLSGLLPETLELVIRAVHLGPEPTIAYSLNRYVEMAGKFGNHLIASVTVATELSDAQKERLGRILSERYGQEVVVHVTVRPSVVGGIRIHVGEDVIDGTLANRINSVKELITK